ncbi:hypothetical protein HZS_102 [Henneguya salminicola]|nr:hypothetical protein HZS_102 [Henneguya salminicola]
MIRQRINLPLTLPSDAAHFITPEQYKISFRNENFLLYDGVENDGERFILFATPRQLNIRSRNSHIDSTFKTVPEIFYQWVVIHGEYNNVLIPCVFALMEQKTEIMYRRVWEKVRENVEIACQTAMCDFEMASIDSFMFYYPSTPLTGCFFHFSQCIWRRIESGGQSTLYRDMKHRGQSFRCLRLLHLLKKIMLFKRMKHWKNIYASMVLNNNSENF